ncbi:MAG TPA: hypothetical protein VIG80_00600 [Bacillaceae bacterium]
MKKNIFFTGICAVMLVLGACGPSAKESGSEHKTSGSEEKEKTSSLKMLENDKTGEYLADANGMTLYYFTKDEPGKSNCTGECLKNWPPFTAGDFDVPDGFDIEDFGTIKREDSGSEQVTYKGYPLYYFSKDKQEGDVNGQGVKDVWYILNSKTDLK